MLTLLLIIIYLSFISLGLPDSLLGSAWPVIQKDLSMDMSTVGIISIMISSGTIVSSLLSGKLINRFGTGKVTFVSVAMTAVALFGFSIAPSFTWLCIVSIPLGLGAGSVDAALNNFVAVHYKANHMSWLHCFWGVGATLGPIIMSFFIARNNDWKNGYFTISMIQFFLVFILFVTLPLWNKIERNRDKVLEEEKNTQNVSAIKIPGVKLALITFVCYCATETTTGLWASSYLVNYKGISVEEAARWSSLFYAGITVGRLLTGFLTVKFNNSILIRYGQIICIIGVISLILPLPTYFFMIGLIFIGLGCAPIFPSMIHETPKRFGEAKSQSVMGLQMAFGYIGSTVMPPILGFIASRTSIRILPYFLLCYILIMFVSSEKINRFMKNMDISSREVQNLE